MEGKIILKKCIQLWNPKEKTEFIKLLSEKTDTYNFTNVNYSSDCFLVQYRMIGYAFIMWVPLCQLRDGQGALKVG